MTETGATLKINLRNEEKHEVKKKKNGRHELSRR